jgi:hypothetical protein
MNPIARTNADFRFHLAGQTVRTFELVYEGGKTEVLLSAETLEDMRKYAGLLSLVYGGMKLHNADRSPRFLGQLSSLVGLSKPDAQKDSRTAN